MSLLEVKNLQVEVGGKKILNGLDLSVNAGEVHAIMGPNGSGKSTFSYVLAGRQDYKVTGGSVRFEGEDLLALQPDERAAKGVFLAFQYPARNSGRHHHDVPAHRRECRAQETRRAGNLDARFPALRARKGRRLAHRSRTC